LEYIFQFSRNNSLTFSYNINMTKTNCICGTDLQETILDNIDDSHNDNRDGYYEDSNIVLVFCPKCDTFFEVEFDEDNTVTEMVQKNQVKEGGQCICIEEPRGDKKNDNLEGFSIREKYKYELMTLDKNGKPYVRLYPDGETKYYETCSVRTFNRLFNKEKSTMKVHTPTGKAVKVIKSTRYLAVKVVIEHAETVDPEDVINECEYDFTSMTDKAVIDETEIKGITDTFPGV